MVLSWLDGEDTVVLNLRSHAAIAIDQEGNVYVADTGNNRIQVFSNTAI
jgi:DNA-binding beta-propeller fold protein YncE